MNVVLNLKQRLIEIWLDNFKSTMTISYKSNNELNSMSNIGNNELNRLPNILFAIITIISHPVRLKHPEDRFEKYPDVFQGSFHLSERKPRGGFPSLTSTASDRHLKSRSEKEPETISSGCGGKHKPQQSVSQKK